MDHREPGFETLLAHAGEDPRRYEGAIVPPIYQTSLFTSRDVAAYEESAHSLREPYYYTRINNPTTEILQVKLAAIEKAEAARCFGSGMAAVTAAIMHAVKAGDHVVAVETIYGPARSALSTYLAKFGIYVTYVDGTDPQQFADASRPNTRLFYLESPSSLVFRLQNLPAVVAIAHERGISTVLDNSWASPYFQNPLEFGVDVVLHSATKYLSGHSDVVAGAMMGSRDRIDAISEHEGSLLGATLDPFAAWLLLRGVRTLAVRLDRHQQSALRVAEFLETHPTVACVHYPGLPSHPQHDLACRQMRGFSGLLSFELKDGGKPAAAAVVNRLRFFGIGVSWGGYESLVVPLHFRSDRWGMRLHVGLETVEDLVQDLADALESANGA